MNFLLSIGLNFLLLRISFLQCFLLMKPIIVFFELVFLSFFPNWRQASIQSNCIFFPMSDKIEATVFSNGLSGIFSEIIDKTNLFLLAHYPQRIELLL